MVAALRICGDPTVRAAWASAGSIDATGRTQLGMGHPGTKTHRGGERVVAPRAQLGRRPTARRSPGP